MATEKTINTRIQLKYSSLEEWSDLSVAGKGGNLVLKAGEVGICAVPRGGSHLQTTPPAIMFKVGDGTTAFKDLPWASGLAADVYPWAKAPTPPTGDGTITIKQAGVTKGTFTVNQTGNTTIELTDNNSDTNTQYKLELEDHKLILKSKEIGETTYNTVVSTITLPDNDTTYTFATGDTDGTFKVTPSGGSAQNVKIKNVMVSTGGAFTGAVTVQAPTAAMNPATKQYVDSAIKGVSQFKYQVVTTLPTASADTMGTIYLVAHTHNTDPEVTVGTNDTYDEYLTIQKGSEYSWEKIGNTDIDLSGYYNSLLQTGSGVVTDVSEGASGQIMVTRTSLTAADPTASGTATDFIATVKQDANGKITATKKSVATMTGATLSAAGAKGLVPAPASGDRTKFLRGDGTWAAVDKANQLALSRSIDGVEFNGSESITHYGECDTAAATAEKAVVCNWFTLVTGARIAVKFTNSNSASNPTLNVHGTGAKPIYYRGSAILASYLAANRTYEFIYNGTQYDLVGDINIDTGVTDVEVTGSGNAVTSATISGRKLTLAKGATFLTSHQDISGKQDKITSTNKLSASLVSGLATVATSGNYNDLSNKPDNATTSAAGLMSAADKTKLDGIAIDATKVTDATVSGWGYIKSYTDTNQKISSGTTTFGANDTIEIKAGTNITVDASSATKTITINGKSNDDINSLIDTKIGALDVSNITGFSASKTLATLTETDGKIAATFQDISITASQVSDFNNKVDARIGTHTGIDKTGTVTKVEAGTGLKVTGTPSVTPKVEIDDSVVFVLNCGSATVNV